MLWVSDRRRSVFVCVICSFCTASLHGLSTRDDAPAWQARLLARETVVARGPGRGVRNRPYRGVSIAAETLQQISELTTVAVGDLLAYNSGGDWGVNVGINSELNAGVTALTATTVLQAGTRVNLIAPWGEGFDELPEATVITQAQRLHQASEQTDDDYLELLRHNIFGGRAFVTSYQFRSRLADTVRGELPPITINQLTALFAQRADSEEEGGAYYPGEQRIGRDLNERASVGGARRSPHDEAWLGRREQQGRVAWAVREHP